MRTIAAHKLAQVHVQALTQAAERPRRPSLLLRAVKALGRGVGRMPRSRVGAEPKPARA